MRRMALVAAMAALLLVGFAGPIDARSSPTGTVTPAGTFEWLQSNVRCYDSGFAHGYGGTTAREYLRENGVSGTTWMRITVEFQREVGGVWYTTQTASTQDRNQFPNNSDDNWITWHPSFAWDHADATHWVRVYATFEWFHHSSRIYWATRASGHC